jgi:hypothetical protein
VGLFTAPLRDVVGVLDARIRQLQEQGEAVPESQEPAEEPQAEAPAEEAPEEEQSEEPSAEAEAASADEEEEQPDG